MRKPYKRHDLVIAGRSISDWGLKVSDANVFDSPVRSQEEIVVPGRNGELIIDNGSWKNIDITYTCYFEKSNFAKSLADFQSYLGKLKGYQRIEDTIRLGEYRLANLSEMVSIKRDGAGYHSGVFDITFNCKPQRFLKSGEEPIYIMPPLNGTSTPSLYDFRQKGTTVRLLKMPESGSVSFKINYWDSGSAAVSINIGTATAIGWEYTVQTVLPTSYWNVEATLGAGDDPDDLMFEIEGNYRNASGWEYVRAICGRRLEFTNPTGFVCRPTFEINGTIFPIRWISNEDENGNTTEEWVINCDDYSDLTTDAVIDCENEYFYYTDANGKKQNITGKMTITHYADDEQVLPSFPKMGANKTVIYNYLTYSGYTDSFVRMYPHWFTI